MIYGVDVIVIEPGRVRTPIWEKVPAARQFDDTDYGPILRRLLEELPKRTESALPATAVSRVIRRALTARRPRARYAIPDQRLLGWLLPRWLPDRWLDRLIAAGLKRAQS